MDVLVSLAVQSLTATYRLESGALVAMVVAVLAGVLAAYAAWYATGQVISWRRGAEED